MITNRYVSTRAELTKCKRSAINLTQQTKQTNFQTKLSFNYCGSVIKINAQ